MNNSPFEPESFEFDFEDRRFGRSRPPLPPRTPAGRGPQQFRGRPTPPPRTPFRGRPPAGTRPQQFRGRPSSSPRTPFQGSFQSATSSRFGRQFPGQGTSFREPSRFRNWPGLRPFMQTTMASSTAGGGGAQSDMIRMIQSQLAALGFRVPVTGVLGAATRRAVRLFQQSVGLPANGGLDRRTVQTLRAATSRRAQSAPAAPFADDGLADAAAPPEAAPPDFAPPDAEPADAAPNAAPSAEPEPPAADAAPADAQGEVSQNSARKPACQCVGKCTHLEIDRVPLLAAHRGKGGPDLVIVWNDLGSKPQAVDVVVHLHGHAKCRPGQDPRRLNLCRDIQPVSGLDFSDPTGKDPRNGRQRPTIALLPRGNNTGTDGGAGYNFPALSASGGLQRLIDFALAQVTQKLGVDSLRTKRLIITAHSGGGHDLQEILRYADPHEVHVFDGLYNLAQNPRDRKNPYVLTAWAAKRIARDLSAVASGRPVDQYMAATGGALRVISLGTWRLSSVVNQALGKLIPAGSPLAKWYRVEKTRESHCTIPRRFGWQLLAGAGTDIKGLVAAGATSRELEMPGLEMEDAPAGHTITSPGFRPGASNCSATERRIKPIVEPAKSDVASVAAKYCHDKHKKILLERKTYQSYVKLKAAAEADGVPANLLTVVSGYRSIAHQKVLFQRAVEKYGSEKAATRWVAPPGRSAHHTGRAIDFYVGGSNSSANAARQRTLTPYRWLVCNALRFGFTPYAAEPWHWEFHSA
jgi:hypothetical protein